MTQGRTTSASQIRLVVIILLGVVAIILAFQNRQQVDARFLIFTVSMPQWALILATGGAGFIAGWLAGRLRRGR